jgi:hypothetical protein
MINHGNLLAMLEKKGYARFGIQRAFPNLIPIDPMPAKKTTKKVAAKKTVAKKTAVKAAPAKKGAKKTVKKEVGKASVSIEAVAKAAYLNYRRRMELGLPGCHDSDWLEAERSLAD